MSDSATVSGGRREHSTAHIFLSDVLTMQRTHCEGARVALDGLEELAHLGIEPRYGNVLAAKCLRGAHAVGEWNWGLGGRPARARGQH